MVGNQWKTCIRTIMRDLSFILAKHEDDGVMPLTSHLNDVAEAAAVIAKNIGLDENIARKGAMLHDIGKTSSVFQQTLKHGYVRRPGFIFRHEIASLFFISLLKDEEKGSVIEMIAAHHKSVCNDLRGLGLLDLDENENSFSIHSKDFDEWSPVALEILSQFGFDINPISIEEAKANYEYAVDYCNGLGLSFSSWKGVLMASDHFASALDKKMGNEIKRLFIKPDLSFYNRTHELFPLSKITVDDGRKNTLERK